jgi:hypothetical protein
MPAHGFTNDPLQLARVRAWVEAAVADGWTRTATYPHESIERACTLRREGWQALVLMRETALSSLPGKWRYETDIHLWGPDRLAVEPGDVYDWQRLQRELRHCYACGARDVDTQRVGFADRVCAGCLPGMKAKIETPGWCD